MRQKRHYLYKFMIFSLMLLPLLASCTPGIVQKTQNKYGQYCTISSNTWRGRWWDYYERGISCAAGKYWSEAISDFKSAIQQRAKDERRVRTYALLIINEYLPHRELGIAYFHIGQYEKAIRELETSLQTVDTAKAKFYLNNARRALFKRSGRPQPRPHIALENLPDHLLTQQLLVDVKGHAEANGYITSLTINGEKQFIDRAEQQISFSDKVPLQAGRNTISIVATDLLGQESNKTLTVVVDRTGPLVSIEQVSVHDNHIRIKAMVLDDSHVTRFKLAGKEVSAGSIPGTFDANIQIPKGMTSLPFAAEDAAGNTTTGMISLKSASSELPKTREGKAKEGGQVRQAVLSPDDMVASLKTFRAAQHQPQTPSDSPAIQIITPENRTTFSTSSIPLRLLIKRGASAIAAFSISHNGALLEKYVGSWLRSPRGVGIYSAQQVDLKTGRNIFDFMVRDTRDRTTTGQIVVNYQRNRAKNADASLHILPVIFPEYQISSDAHIPPNLAIPPELAREIHLYFPEALRTWSRFRIIEEKFRLYNDDIYYDESEISKIGQKLQHTEGVLAVRVYRTSPDEIELSARIVDVDEKVTILEASVPNSDRDTLRQRIDELAEKIVKKFPRVEGEIIDIKYPENRLVLNISEEDGIRQHMKLIVFREGKAYIDNGDKRLGQEIIGEARVIPTLRRNLQQYSPISEAYIIESNWSTKSHEVRIQDKVIIK